MRNKILFIACLLGFNKLFTMTQQPLELRVTNNLPKVILHAIYKNDKKFRIEPYTITEKRWNKFIAKILPKNKKYVLIEIHAVNPTTNTILGTITGTELDDNLFLWTLNDQKNGSKDPCLLPSIPEEPDAKPATKQEILDAYCPGSSSSSSSNCTSDTEEENPTATKFTNEEEYRNILKHW